jgi:hypothetical protein
MLLHVGVCIRYLAYQKKVVPMKQEQVTERIMRVLVQQNLIDPKDYDVIAPFFDQAYAAGHIEGGLQYHKRRPVVQLSVCGKKLAVFESCMIAARKLDTTKDLISKAALGKIETTGGYKWRYLDEY